MGASMIFKYFLRFLVILTWIGLIYLFLVFPFFFKNKNEDEKSLRVYTWANRIDESVLQDFEEKTGIKIYLNYYESAEELLTKIEMMPSLDCDVMLPSAHILQRMIHANLIKKIDKKKCPFINQIYQEFLTNNPDGASEYSIPLYWDVFGLGYNTLKVDHNNISLNMLFDRNSIVGKEVGMTDEAREAIFLAAQYLHLDLNNLDHAELKKIRQLLKDQKSFVGAYTDSQQGYFLASDTFALVASDREIVCRQMQNYDFVKFALIPQGSMLRVDSVVINTQTQKDDLIYEFLNYLFSDEVLLYHAQKFCILPTKKTVFEALEFKYIGVPDLYPGSQGFKKLINFNVGLSQKAINDFWIRFKAS